jgi:tungstate transport system ATP-binding protein
MIELRDVARSFGKTRALSDVNIQIGKGEIFTIIGPSGSGKSTLLRLINLLDAPTEGDVIIRNRPVVESAKEQLELRRTMAMVLQKPVMLTTSVFNNIAIGLRYRKVPKTVIVPRVAEVLSLVGLGGYEKRLATTLSGGEAQRVAIARAMVTRPEILLMDEPTANLDPISTERIEDLILNINKKFRTTIVLATHDLIQGQRLADRMAVVIAGKVIQQGQTDEIFFHPNNRAVARFVGMDNIIEGTVSLTESGIARVSVGGVDISSLSTAVPGEQVSVCIRAEDIVIGTDPQVLTSARNRLSGTIKSLAFEGLSVKVAILCAGIPFIARITRTSSKELGLEPGKEVTLSIKATAVHLCRDR